MPTIAKALLPNGYLCNLRQVPAVLIKPAFDAPLAHQTKVKSCG
jgi:hypothetical protein